MTKITGTIEIYMLSSLKGLFERVLAARPCPIDPHALNDMCTSEKDRVLMERAFVLSGHTKGQIYSTQKAEIPTEGLRIDGVPQEDVDRGKVVLNLSYPRGIKQYPIVGFNPTLASSPEAIKPFMEWLQWRIEYGVAFALADQIVSMFADKGGSLEQMRYAMPGTLTICTALDNLAYLVPRIERFRAPAKPFPLSTDLLREIKIVNEVLAVAALMPERSVAQNITLQTLEVPNYVVAIK